MGRSLLIASRSRVPVRVLGPLAAALVLVLLSSIGPAFASGGTIQVISSSITSEFPRGFRVTVQASGDNEITSVAIRLKMGQKTPGTYNYLDIRRGRVVEGELFWRTETAGRYVPPGTVITYRFEIEDATGARVETEPQQFVYRDSRFEWTEITDGNVTVAYHGPVESRANNVLKAVLETIDRMDPVLGRETGEPITLTIYNNRREMAVALPPGSRAARRELVTEGQATAEFGTILLLGGARGTSGIAAHEATHILVHRVGDSVFQRVPLWLNEGLAEYANVNPGTQYERALEFAISAGRLLPSFLRAYPGSSEATIVFYGQSRSLVRLMIDTFGAAKMRRLMATLKSGKNTADAIQEVYGVTMLELDNMWRESVGAPLSAPGRSARSLPTPMPVRPMLPYSLTPQPGVQLVGDTGAATTPTPVPQAVAEATVTPDAAATSSPEPLLVAAPDREDGAKATMPPSELAPSKVLEPRQGAPAGAGCTAAAHPGPVPVDLATVGLVFGVAGLGLRRRRGPGGGSGE